MSETPRPIGIRLRGRVGKSKRCLAEARNAVSRSHFTGEGLQGIQPLIGVFYLGLELAVLLLQAVLLAAKRIVIRRLPEHSRIGAHARQNRNTAHNRQNRQHMEDEKRARAPVAYRRMSWMQ